MKKNLFLAAIGILLLVWGCNNNCKCNCKCSGCECSKDTSAAAALDFEVIDKAQVDLKDFAVDKDGYITLFDGQTLKGWRGYGMDEPPTSWDVQDGAIHLKGSGTGEAQVEGAKLISEAKSQGVSQSSAIRWNNQWIEQGLINKENHGYYRKVA